MDPPQPSCPKGICSAAQGGGATPARLELPILVDTLAISITNVSHPGMKPPPYEGGPGWVLFLTLQRYTLFSTPLPLSPLFSRFLF